MKYTVVENAGYVGERDVHTANSYMDAIKWRDGRYDDDEIERLRVDIAVDLPDGSRTYEM